MRVGKGVSFHAVVFSPRKCIALPPDPHPASHNGRCSTVADAADGVMPNGSIQLFCWVYGTSVGMSCSRRASPAAGAHPDPFHPSKSIEAVAWLGAPASHPTPGCQQGGFYSLPLSFLSPPSPPSGSQLLITFACQPGLLICYRGAESGRSENKGDTITLCLLSSPIQISFID